MERALRAATWIAAALLLTGLVLWFGGVSYADPVLHAGLWLLIATPIGRVVAAVVDFVAARDWTFLAVTLVVLLSLLFPLAKYFLWSAR